MIQTYIWEVKDVSLVVKNLQTAYIRGIQLLFTGWCVETSPLFATAKAQKYLLHHLF
jgi:hypothetical protein